MKIMMPKYSKKIANLLKSFSNRRTRGSWVLNLTHHRKNFNLISSMYLEVITIKDLRVILLSLLPVKLTKLLWSRIAN